MILYLCTLAESDGQSSCQEFHHGTSSPGNTPASRPRGLWALILFARRPRPVYQYELLRPRHFDSYGHLVAHRPNPGLPDRRKIAVLASGPGDNRRHPLMLQNAADASARPRPKLLKPELAARTEVRGTPHRSASALTRPPVWAKQIRIAKACLLRRYLRSS